MTPGGEDAGAPHARTHDPATAEAHRIRRKAPVSTERRDD
jgi:hypothetical protein